jgi:phage terminase large subunit-like protein
MRLPVALNARQRLAKRRRATFAPPPWPFDYLSKYRLRSRQAQGFVERECIVPSGRGLGKPYRLRAFQVRLLRATLDDPEVRVAVWSLPRGAGKTGLVAALALWLLYEREGADVIVASTGMRTARLSFDRAVRMVGSNDRLADQAIYYANAVAPMLELPERGSTLRPLPAEEPHLVGQSPTAVIVDEVGFVTQATYRVLQTALGKADRTLLLGVGTPGLGVVEQGDQPNVMYQLRGVAAGRDAPRALVYLEHAAPADADPSKPSTWRKANPGAGVFVSLDAIRTDYETLSLQTFAQYRLGLWGQHERAWVRAEAWDALTHEPGLPEPGAAVALGFDGSSSRDSTALVALELDRNRLHVLGHWSAPTDSSRRGWRVPRRDVQDAIADAFDLYRVVGLFADPYLWRSELQEWADRWGADVVQELDSARAAKMGPASDAFLADVQQGRLSTDGSEALRAHVLSAVAVTTKAGDVITKDARRPSHIDLAVAAILAHEAARVLDVPLPVIY